MAAASHLHLEIRFCGNLNADCCHIGILKTCIQEIPVYPSRETVRKWHLKESGFQTVRRGSDKGIIAAAFVQDKNRVGAYHFLCVRRGGFYAGL